MVSELVGAGLERSVAELLLAFHQGDGVWCALCLHFDLAVQVAGAGQIDGVGVEVLQLRAFVLRQ